MTQEIIAHPTRAGTFAIRISDVFYVTSRGRLSHSTSDARSFAHTDATAWIETANRDRLARANGVIGDPWL